MKLEGLSPRQSCISRYLTANHSAGVANWACAGKKKVGSGPTEKKKQLQNHIKSCRRLQAAGTGVWTWQQHHCHEHRGTLTRESLGWAGSQKFSAGSLLALVSAGGTKHIPHQHFTSKVLIFLVMFPIRELHWSTSHHPKYPCALRDVQAVEVDSFLFVCFFDFFVFPLSDGSPINVQMRSVENLTTGISRTSTWVPLFSSVVQTDQAAF